MNASSALALEAKAATVRSSGAAPAAVPGEADRIAPEDAIVCASCFAPLTQRSAMLVVQGTHEHVFINPQGYVFHVRCFSSARSITSLGAPSAEFSWFAGYLWTIVSCASCGMHVGWRFDGDGHRFYAFIAEQIVEPA